MTANIWNDPDPDLGHGKLTPLGDDTDRRVSGQPDPSAHRDPVHNPHDRDGRLVRHEIKHVLPLNKACCPACVVVSHGLDITAPAQAAFPFSLKENRLRTVVPGRLERLDEPLNHVEVERINGSWTVKSDVGDSPDTVNKDLIFTHVPIVSRAALWAR